MIASNELLREMLDEGELVVEPLDRARQLQPASIDLSLGDHFLKVEENSTDCISLTDPVHYTDIRSDTIIIPPLSFMLATTREHVELPGNMTAFVEGRSSIGRLGLFIQNAGWVDPGFRGSITLELFNANRLPIRLSASQRICQVVFALLDRHTSLPYVGKYQGQSGTVGSRVHLDDR